MSGGELRGQEEVACACMFRLTQTLQWVINIDDCSKFTKCCTSATITVIA